MLMCMNGMRVCIKTVSCLFIVFSSFFNPPGMPHYHTKLTLLVILRNRNN